MNKESEKIENQNILLATNGSKAARNACFYALEMFKGFPCTFFLVNAYQGRGPHSPFSKLGPSIEKRQSLLMLEEEIKFLKEKFPYLPIEAHPSLGPLAYVINQYSKKIGDGFLIMGSKRAKSWIKSILGTNCSRLIGKTKLPILIIPEHIKFKPFKKIILATDFIGLDDPKIISPVAQLASHYNACIILYHIYNHQAPNKKAFSLEKLLEGPSFDKVRKMFTYTEGENTLEQFETYLKNYPADLLVVISREYGLMKNWLHSSISKRLSLMLPIPLLILQEPN
ncbi:universal stress protein [Xanthovirga aplysinae]|uniref:universal stress protein n=1 Tax=Xanthovirga aplysinae TaxID=2529853 RepID=UPI0012BCED08|nr:universal stress protein [Xanthovirga aplysinae]